MPESSVNSTPTITATPESLEVLVEGIDLAEQSGLQGLGGNPGLPQSQSMGTNRNRNPTRRIRRQFAVWRRRLGLRIGIRKPLFLIRRGRRHDGPFG